MTGTCLALFGISAANAQSTSCLPGELNARLSEVRSNFGSIQVISTHRPGATIAGSGKPSYHRWCRAVDFRPPAGKYAAVVAFLNSKHSGGLGTYSSGHIHIDNGPYIRFSKGWSGGSVQLASSRAGRGRGSSSTAAKSENNKGAGWTKFVEQ